MTMMLLATGGTPACLKRGYSDLERRTTSGDRLVIPDPAGQLANSSLTAVKRLDAESLTAHRIAAAAVLLRLAPSYLCNITRTKTASAPRCPSRASIPA